MRPGPASRWWARPTIGFATASDRAYAHDVGPASILISARSALAG
jgi:hypothetical protein